MPIRSSREMVEAALAEVRTLDAAAAVALHGAPGVVFVDLREPGEGEREGGIPGAEAAPRGLIEFWFDPASPWQRPALTRPDARYVLFCALGWRSALAAQTLQRMGLPRERVSHVGGGFAAWRAAGGPVRPGSAAPPADAAAIVPSAAGPGAAAGHGPPGS